MPANDSDTPLNAGHLQLRRGRRPWLRAGAAVAVLVAGVVAAIATSSPPQGREADTLVVAFPREVRTLDGNYSNTRELDILGLLVDDALFMIDPDTSRIRPLSALSHRFVDDRTLEVQLRRDVTFHDGRSMTAHDVVYTYSWLLSPQSQAEFAPRFRRWLDRVEATGPFTVRFHMRAPYAMALYDLAMYSKIRQRGAYDDPSAPGGVDPGALTRRLNGTGPYRVVAFQSGDGVWLERYAGYRSASPKGRPDIGAIHIRVIPDLSTQAAEIVAGGVGWTYGVPTDLAEDVARTDRATFLAGPSMRVGYVVFDASGAVAPGGPLTQPDVRRALNMAIDRQAIVSGLIRGGAQVAHTPCLPVQFGCDAPVRRYAYDLSAARALLAQAGYPDGFDIDLWAARDKDVIEAIAAMWGRVGVRTRVRYVKSAALAKAINERQAAAYFTSYGSYGIPDAGAILPDRLGRENPNALHGDEALYRALGVSSSSYDPQVRQAAFRQALTRIADQAYVAPVFEYTQNFLMSLEVAYTQAPDGMPRLYAARWRRPADASGSGS